jgi:hypothetical protein
VSTRWTVTEKKGGGKDITAKFKELHDLKSELIITGYMTVATMITENILLCTWQASYQDYKRCQPHQSAASKNLQELAQRRQLGAARSLGGRLLEPECVKPCQAASLSLCQGEIGNYLLPPPHQYTSTRLAKVEASTSLD